MINKELLQQMINEKLVSVQKHPEADLFIYNYTPKVQYEKIWNEVTIITRGLILDSQMNYVARPFGKFFNLEEYQPNEMPALPFDVYEKMDGSLGILYWYNDKPFIATRGSFISEQSQHATELLHNRYKHVFDKLDKNATYLFEIIYPQNRIVVDYGEMDDLVLLTVIDNETADERIEHIGFPTVLKFDGINHLQELKELEENNKEGFVVRFKNGFRVKMKFAEYLRLHRIITGVSNVAIWEYLAQGKSFDELLEKVPDEFYNWVKLTVNDLQNKFDLIKQENEKIFWQLIDKKEFAEKAKQNTNQHLLFTRLNSYSTKMDEQIWKIIRPQYSKPFKTDI